MPSLTNHPSTAIEIAVGRALALIVHPYAAWRTQSTMPRVFLLASYGAAGFVMTLALLLFAAPV